MKAATKDPLRIPSPGDWVRVVSGRGTGAEGRVDFVDAAGGRALIDRGGGRAGGLAWFQLHDLWAAAATAAPASEPARSGCPCEWTEPCSPRCSCARPAEDGGCARCCRHGSDAERRKAAKRLARALDRAEKIRAIAARAEAAARCTSSPDACRVQAGDILVAYHSPAIVRNGWQPYDQPDTAAYLPRGFEDLEVASLRSGGAVLVFPRRRLESVSPEILRRVSDGFRKGGAPREAAQVALRLLRRPAGRASARASKAEAPMNDCGHQCFIIGGPFIAEDPACPVHGGKRKAGR